MSFNDLGLSEKLSERVQELGYKKPTPIQVKAIPEALTKRKEMSIANRVGMRKYKLIILIPPKVISFKNSYHFIH